MCIIIIGKPKYTLSSSHIEAKTGDSPKLKFTVECDPPLPRGQLHTLTKKKNGRVRFEVDSLKGEIIFHEVEARDTDEYTIQCCSPYDLSGKKTFKLTVTEPVTTFVAQKYCKNHRPNPRPSKRKKCILS